MVYMCKNKDLKKKYDLSSVKTILCGAAPLSKDIERDFVELYMKEGLSQGDWSWGSLLWPLALFKPLCMVVVYETVFGRGIWSSLTQMLQNIALHYRTVTNNYSSNCNILKIIYITL